MYLYTLKQLRKVTSEEVAVVNRFKKNVSLHVETTSSALQDLPARCESL